MGLGYSVAHVALNSSTQRLRHTGGYPFGAVLYAFGNMTGLSLPAGLTLIDKFSKFSVGRVKKAVQHKFDENNIILR